MPKGNHLLAAAAAAGAAGLGVAMLVWHLSPPGGSRGTETFATGDETIFVSVASYRDADCLGTLKSMFDNADNPKSIVAGVCEQNTKAAGELCLPAEFEWHDHVRRISVPHTEAKGPTYARYLCSTLYRDETYFCQIDSHTRFVKGWDTRAIAQIKGAPSKKAVLTHYPHDWKNTDADNVPVLCKSKFDAQGMVTFEAATLPKSKTPKPVPFTSGGFVFGPGRMVRDVPYDPNLPHLFQGEELLYSARLWTSGYDFFTPTENLVFHHYYRKQAPKFWEDLNYSSEQQQTLAKVLKVLGGKLPGYSHGMGSQRTLAAYWEYAGIDWKTKITSSEAKFCK